MPEPRIAIVTAWRDHLELADDYFEAALPEMQEGDELLLVDNASDPPLPFGTLRSEINLGFAGGSNLALNAATAGAVCFLNNDVALGQRGWLGSIREALAPGVLVGPLRAGVHTRVEGVDFPYIDGWCLAGMRSDLLGLGGFDKDLEEPAYYSDNLLCLAAREAGMTLREVRVRLKHKENATAGPAWTPEVQRASQANRDRYIARARALLAAV